MSRRTDHSDTRSERQKEKLTGAQENATERNENARDCKSEGASAELAESSATCIAIDTPPGGKQRGAAIPATSGSSQGYRKDSLVAMMARVNTQACQKLRREKHTEAGL